MNIPNMINTLITEAFDLKPVLSPKTREIPKSPNSKAKLRNFVLPGHSAHKKEVTSPASKSISHHKLSGEYTQKDILSTKNNHSSLDQNSYNKIFEAKKEAKKSSNIILASFLKNSAIKHSLVGPTNKPTPVETVVLDLKAAATLKNPTRTSPYNKRASPVPNMKELKITSESVSQLQSPKAKNGDFYGTEPLKNRLAVVAAATSKTNNSQDPELAVKKMSPKRLKAKEDRTGISDVLYDNKRHFKRKGVYRSRQSSNYTETLDDPASKLSTNAPSAFSEARRSIPSQKSSSLIKQNHNETTINEDFISSRQKTRHNTEIKFNESYDISGGQNIVAAHKSKQPSMKDKPAVAVKIEARLKHVTRNEARSPKSMDGGAYGKLLKTFYMQKKDELRRSKISKATSSHVSFLKEDGHLGSFYKEQIRNLLKNNCDMKKTRERPSLRLETRFSEPKNPLLLNVSSNRNLLSPNGRELDNDLVYDMKRMAAKNELRRELRKTKSLSPPKMKIYTEGIPIEQNHDNGKIFLKDALSLRSAFSGMAAMETNKVYPLPQQEEQEDSESPKECSLHTSTIEIPTESNLSVNRNNERVESGAGLYKIYQKTRNMMENFRVKENSWTNEKSLLLEHIQNLENRLKVYEDLVKKE